MVNCIHNNNKSDCGICKVICKVIFNKDLYCNFCNQHFKSRNTFIQHHGSTDHYKNSLKASTKYNKGYFCEDCIIDFPDSSTLKNHYITLDHKKREKENDELEKELKEKNLKILKELLNIENLKYNKGYYCRICKIDFPDSSKIQNHYITKKHINKYKKENY